MIKLKLSDFVEANLELTKSNYEHFPSTGSDTATSDANCIKMRLLGKDNSEFQ